MLLFSPNSFCPLNFSLRILKIKIYKTIILPVVRCNYEKLTLTLREERGLTDIGKQDPEANIWVQEVCEWGVEKSP